MNEETKKLLESIHDEVQSHSRNGEAMVWGYGPNPTVVYYDDKTEMWLVAAHVEGEYNLFPSDDFPKGLELGVSWGDAEWVPVEETALYHETYGLNHAREGYGPVVGQQ